MTLADLEHFRNLLLERQQTLSAWIDSGGVAPPHDTHKAHHLLIEIREALARVDNRSFGACQVCRGEVEQERLEIQPTTQVCLDCISRQEQEQLEEELFLASKIHRALLPQTVARIDGFEVAVRSLAARTIGGDYYDFLPARGGIARMVIADAMGKGIPAGMIMSNIQGGLRVLADEILSPGELISRLNRWLCRNVPVTKFVSMAVVAVEAGSGPASRIYYANAGHCPPILIRADGKLEKLPPTGGVIGVHEGFTYEERELSLGPGDMLFLYTDGLTEAESESGTMFGEEGAGKFVCGLRNRPLEEILNSLLSEIQSFTGRKELADDYTVLALRKKT